MVRRCVAVVYDAVSNVMMQIAPKEDELRAFQAYDGTYDDLSPPEQFLYTMASVPRLNDKINVLILMHQFEVSYLLETDYSANRLKPLNTAKPGPEPD